MSTSFNLSSKSYGVTVQMKPLTSTFKHDLPFSINDRLQNSPYFGIFKYAQALKKEVWNEAENRERDWGETLKIRACEARELRARKTYATLYRFHY